MEAGDSGRQGRRSMPSILQAETRFELSGGGRRRHGKVLNWRSRGFGVRLDSSVANLAGYGDPWQEGLKKLAKCWRPTVRPTARWKDPFYGRLWNLCPTRPPNHRTN